MSRQSVPMCDYEMQQLKRLELNAERMKAKGYGDLAYKILQNKYDQVARGISETSSEDMDYQFEPDVISNLPSVDSSLKESNKHVNCSRAKKGKQPLTQQKLSMAELLALKTTKRQKIKDNQHHQPPFSIQGPDSSQSTRKSEKCSSVQPQGNQQKKALDTQEKNQPPLVIQETDSQRSGPSLNELHNVVQPQGNQKKKVLSTQEKNQKQYCAPGSLSRFKNMRKTQSAIGQQPPSFTDESLRPQQLSIITGVNQVEDENPGINEDIGNCTNEEVNVSVEVVEDDNPAPKKKHRGRTVLDRIYARSIDDRDPIILNNLNQLVGPTKKIVDDFVRFLGTVAQNSTLAPLNYLSWKDVPMSMKDKIWDFVQTKFIVPEAAKGWVLKSVNKKWTRLKSTTRKKHYTKYETMEQRLANRPPHIPEDDFQELLEFWDTEQAQEISRKNAENWKKQTDMHTMGPISFARKRHEMQQNHPNKRAPSQGELYVESRKRVPRRQYLTQDEETLKNIEKMKELQSLEDGADKSDPYSAVFTKKEHSGYLRLYGLGVTKSTLKSKDSKTPFILPSVFMDNIMQEMKKKISEEVEQRVSGFISKIREANTGRDFVIPDFPTNQDDESTHDNVARDHIDES